jgi:hypothetical protein
VLVAGFGAGAVVYVVAARLLRAEELGQAIGMIRRRRPEGSSI